MSDFNGTGSRDLKDIRRLEEQVAQLQAERDSLMNDMQRIYDSCSDVDLIIDIAGAAVDYNQGDE
jgi:archaellum component FlaC